MTSTKFLGFGTPSFLHILVRYTVLNPRNLPYFIHFATNPLPPSQSRRHISIAPKSTLWMHLTILNVVVRGHQGGWKERYQPGYHIRKPETSLSKTKRRKHSAGELISSSFGLKKFSWNKDSSSKAAEKKANRKSKVAFNSKFSKCVSLQNVRNTKYGRRIRIDWAKCKWGHS